MYSVLHYVSKTLLGYCDMEQLDANDIALLLSLLSDEQLVIIIAAIATDAHAQQQ